MKENAEGTYKTKHAEAARLIYKVLVGATTRNLDAPRFETSLN